MSLEQTEKELASHIRNPANEAPPRGIEQRRLKIYRDLFYNNIENFIASGFPILRSLFADDAWHSMVRDFMIQHRCHTPYFLEISQEFLLYLQNTRASQPDDPAFMSELAHYEWVELALDIADEDLHDIEVNVTGDLLTELPLVSPLAWSLCYQYPVHKIGRDFLPDQPGDAPTYLIVYRNREDAVGFMEANSVTARLLELLAADNVASGYQALEVLATELQHPQPQQVIDGGVAIFQQLQGLDIILGTQKAP